MSWAPAGLRHRTSDQAPKGKAQRAGESRKLQLRADYPERVQREFDFMLEFGFRRLPAPAHFRIPDQMPDENEGERPQSPPLRRQCRTSPISSQPRAYRQIGSKRGTPLPSAQRIISPEPDSALAPAIQSAEHEPLAERRSVPML